MFQTLKMLPGHVLGIEGELLGIVAFTLGALVWLVAPLVDRRPGHRASRAFTVLGWAVLAYIAAFTALMYVKS
jgi:uncharacterized membrane protein